MVNASLKICRIPRKLRPQHKKREQKHANLPCESVERDERAKSKTEVFSLWWLFILMPVAVDSRWCGGRQWLDQMLIRLRTRTMNWTIYIYRYCRFNIGSSRWSAKPVLWLSLSLSLSCAVLWDIRADWFAHFERCLCFHQPSTYSYIVYSWETGCTIEGCLRSTPLHWSFPCKKINVRSQCKT